MGKLSRVFTAYVIASGATIPPGLVGAEVARNWLTLPSLDPLHVIGALWFFAVGVPSVNWARNYLGATLGVRQPITVQAMGDRRITVAGAMADAVQSIFGQPQAHATSSVLHVAEGIVLERGHVRVREPELADFLRGAYARQLAGKRGFSRNYWVDGPRQLMQREKYELALDTLVYHELAEGRVKGGSGRLIYSATLTLAHLRHYYGRPGN